MHPPSHFNATLDARTAGGTLLPAAAPHTLPAPLACTSPPHVYVASPFHLATPAPCPPEPRPPRYRFEKHGRFPPQHPLSVCTHQPLVLQFPPSNALNFVSPSLHIYTLAAACLLHFPIAAQFPHLSPLCLGKQGALRRLSICAACSFQPVFPAAVWSPLLRRIVFQ